MTSSVFESAETSRLERAVQDARREAAAFERDKERLAGLLATERGVASGLASELEQARKDLVEVRRRLGNAEAIVATAAQHEQACLAAEKQAGKLAAKLELSEAAHAEAEAVLRGATAELAETRAVAARLGEEIGPFRNLIAALQARHHADETIAVELGRLGG